VAESSLALSVTVEQIAAVIRQMSSADRQRLLDLVPELRQASQSTARTSYQARSGPKPPSSGATSGEYDETAGPGQRPKSSGSGDGALDVGIDWMADLSRNRRHES